MKFQNPVNDYVEESSMCGLWCFLFGIFYFMYKGIWGHAVIFFIAGMCTMGLSLFVYPFFAGNIVRKNYLTRGWKEVRDDFVVIT